MKIKFVPQNIEVDLVPGKSLLSIAQDNNIFIKSICKGVPSCAECRVKIKEGENNVLPPTKVELNLLGTNYFVDHRRLACQVKCFGSVVVDLSEQEEKAQSQNKKIRGFRSSKGDANSHAKQGTMILDEKIEAEAEPPTQSEAKAPTQNEKPAQKHHRHHKHKRK